MFRVRKKVKDVELCLLGKLKLFSGLVSIFGWVWVNRVFRVWLVSVVFIRVLMVKMVGCYCWVSRRILLSSVLVMNWVWKLLSWVIIIIIGFRLVL